MLLIDAAQFSSASGLAGDDLGELQRCFRIVGPALRPGRDRALACADLWLGAAGFGLGATRDISLGGVAADRDWHFRKDHVRHFAFHLDAEGPLDRIRAAARSASKPKHGSTIDSFSQLTPGRYLSSPGLWLGLMFAALFIAAQSGCAVIADRFDFIASQSTTIRKNTTMHPTKKPRASPAPFISRWLFTGPFSLHLCSEQTDRARQRRRDGQQYSGARNDVSFGDPRRSCWRQ